MIRPLRLAILLGVALALTACERQPAAQASAPAPSDEAPAAAFVPAAAVPAPTFNATRAMKYTKEIVAFGPRPIGSAGHKKVEEYILAHLKGDQVEDDAFMADTPEGKLPVRNIIAKYPGTRDGIILIASHYDTNYPLRNTAYVGANDGAATSAILLEIANQLRGKKRDGYSVWLLWTDGEEAVKTWTQTDSLYGTRHIAEKWQADSTLKKIKGVFVADMIGDADLSIDHDMNSTAWLVDLVRQAATNLGYQSHFFSREIATDDDHTPFLKKSVPAVDLIDFDYGYGNVFWHTPQDTMDKLSAKSLEISGSVLMEAVRLLDQKQ